MEGVIGGYHGDIAISDASLAISDSCSFAPDEAKQNTSGCDNGSALGMQSGAIPDSHITASSQHSDGLAAPRSRLYILGTGSLFAAWLPSAHDQDQWLQIDIGEPLSVVTAVATQGRGDHPRWVTSYKLQYSDKHTTDFQFYTEQGSTDSKIFPGNTDQHTVICHKLNPPIKGRYIRFRPWTWNGKIAMRVELYGFRAVAGITVMNKVLSTSVIERQVKTCFSGLSLRSVGETVFSLCAFNMLAH
ncbi:PREDICTED: retinoschisin-like [Acropora digitifera]|uniref:retinoschisin-like n=1 Tax=Acropora digitifera TaxID=70779 RepID=UPI00077A815B|nr:PREDICTED: retinoschisin-like [Acropora digitifera]